MDWLNKPPKEEVPTDSEVTTDIDLDGDSLADRTETVMKISKALVRYTLHTNADVDGDGKADRRIRSDFFNAQDVCQKIEIYTYDSAGRKIQVRSYDGSGAKTGTVAWVLDDAGKIRLTAQWDGTDTLLPFTVAYFDGTGRNHRTAQFRLSAEGAPELVSQTWRTYLNDTPDSPLTLQAVFSDTGSLVSAESFSYRTSDPTTTPVAVKTTYGADGVITGQETVRWASDYLPDPTLVPIEGFDLEDYELTVKETFVRGIRELAAIPESDWAALAVPAVPEEPGTPDYELSTDTSGLSRDLTVIQAWDPYGSTEITLDPLTFNLSDNSILVGAASQARETLKNIPEALIPFVPDVEVPAVDLPYRPRQIIRRDSRIAEPITLDLTYDAFSRPLKKITSYGDTKALELGFVYGTEGNSEYLLTQVEASGEAMIIPLKVSIVYDTNKLPSSLEVSSSGTVLSSFEFDYGAVVEGAAQTVAGFDPVKAAQDPLAFGSRLLEVMKEGWTIRHYGMGTGTNKLPAAEYSFVPQTSGLKATIRGWNAEAASFSVYKGYYLLTLDQDDKALKFQIWLGSSEETVELKESTSYAYGTWGEKLYEYKAEFEGFKAGVEKELAGSELLTFLGLGGSTMEDMAASLMTLLFR